MDTTTRNVIDDLVKKQLTKLESRLFALNNLPKVVKILKLLDSMKKNDTDVKFYNKMNEILKNSIYAKWQGMITAWSHASQLFKITANANEKIQAPRKPYAYETHKLTYEKPHHYFQADLADMAAFNYNFGYRPQFCLVVVDGVSGKVYLRVTGKKTADKVLNSFREIFKTIKRPNDEKHIFLQTDAGGEFFNNKMKEWCKSENIKHFHSKHYGKAYLAESVIGRLKGLYQKLQKDPKNKLKKNNWSFFIEKMESRLNETEKTVSGISPEDLDGENASSKALRMIDQYATLQHKKHHFVSNHFNRVKKEFQDKKMKILKPLQLGTECYLRKYKQDPEDTFSKSTTRNRAYWDTSKKVVITKIIKRSNPSIQGYLPVFIYKIAQVDNRNKTFKVKREDLLPIGEKDADIYYKTFKDYERNFYQTLDDKKSQFKTFKEYKDDAHVKK